MSRIAVVGGTGHLGAAIAKRLAKAGHQIAIGSRSAESAEKAAAEIGHGATGGANAQVASGADFVIVTVPYGAQAATLEEIKDRVGSAIVVDATVPLKPRR